MSSLPGRVLRTLVDIAKLVVNMRVADKRYLIFPMTNVTILGVFPAHAQKEYGKVWEMRSTPILSILALYTFLKLAMHLLKVWSKRHPV